MRDLGVFAIGISGAALLLASPAQALIGKVCADDGGCPAGYTCSKETSTAFPTTPAPPPETAPKDSGTTTATTSVTRTTTTTATATSTVTTASTGVCAPAPKTCATDADCGADSACNLPPSPACASGEVCPASGRGTCSPVKRPCGTNADCPASLVCKSNGSACTGGASVERLPDGGTITTTTTPVCTPDPAVCTWIVQACTNATGCARTDEECVDTGWLQAHCTASCDTEWCTEVCTPGPLGGAGMCFPKYVDCSAGQACPEGSSCVDFAGIEDGLPPWWSHGTAMKACLPDGLRMVFEQKAGADNTASETTAGGSDSPKGTVTAPTGGTSATTNATTNTNTNTTTSTGSGTVAKESKSQDSCSLGGGGGAWAALLASLALVAFRRKRARDR